MATFVSLINFTDQGIRSIRESPERYAAFRAMAEQMGLAVKGCYYTMGSYDLVVIVEGPEETATAALLKVGSLGNIRSQTMRAYSPEEMNQIIGRMP